MEISKAEAVYTIFDPSPETVPFPLVDQEPENGEFTEPVNDTVGLLTQTFTLDKGDIVGAVETNTVTEEVTGVQVLFPVEVKINTVFPFDISVEDNVYVTPVVVGVIILEGKNVPPPPAHTAPVPSPVEDCKTELVKVTVALLAHTNWEVLGVNKVGALSIVINAKLVAGTQPDSFACNCNLTVPPAAISDTEGV